LPCVTTLFHPLPLRHSGKGINPSLWNHTPFPGIYELIPISLDNVLPVVWGGRAANNTCFILPGLAGQPGEGNARGPIPAFAPPRGKAEGKCRNHQDHEQLYVSSEAFEFDIRD
jgi:hypothetical protein